MNDADSEFSNIEVVLIVRTLDTSVFSDFQELFPNPDDISLAKRAIGGAEIKSWFPLSKLILEKILKLIANNSSKVSEATLVIGAKETKLVGYCPEDVLVIMNSPAFQEAIKAYTLKSG